MDIDALVEELDVAVETKGKLKETLKKFPVLFGLWTGFVGYQTSDD